MAIEDLLEPPEPPNRLRVVIVDDSPSILGLFEEVIIPDDDPLFELVGTALNVAHGLQTVLERKPDVVILDYELPGGDGLSLLREIRSARSSTIVFLMSGHEDFSRLEAEAREAGALDFIPKPRGDDSAVAVRMLLEQALERRGVAGGSAT